MVNSINSASVALFGITTIITNRKNPSNTGMHQNGLQGANQQSRIPTNLGNNNHKICSILPGNMPSPAPQPTVTNTSSLLRKRVNSCTSGSQGKNCGNTNFKLQNPLNHTISSYIGRNSTLSQQCVYSNIAYENYSKTCSNLCEKPIVKITDTPLTSTFLRTQYFNNNCLPSQPRQKNKPNYFTIDQNKIMQNKNCGGSNGGC